ncbi:MAG: VWA domain-containing protein [Spirochaetes bacterium]|nr:VWA domain-containing protein [Spirochaetota bacterium]
MSKPWRTFIAAILVLTGISCAEKMRFAIISGSENKSLEPLVIEFGKRENVEIEMRYLGSVDISKELSKDDPPCDAVWPASSIWITIGDSKSRVKHVKSVMHSPVVIGVRKSLAQKLNWIGREVKVKEILMAIKAKKLSFMMTSATQSNSGAMAYFGFLYALLGNPEKLNRADLYRSDLKANIRTILSGIHRSSGSSGWLKELYLTKNYDAMVNYESLIIETNFELIKKGREPLFAIYPADGLCVADSPLGYVNRGNPKKEKFFLKLQEHLLSKEVQQKLVALGRRPAISAFSLDEIAKTIFNPEWGIDAQRNLTPIKLPSEEVISEALALYQTAFRKPSLTVYCLDFSGSMAEVGIDQLRAAMELILNPDRAREYLIQPSGDDIVMVIPFNHAVLWHASATGANAFRLKALLAKLKSQQPFGGTDIYTPTMLALNKMKKYNTSHYMPAIVLMTDGESNTGASFADLEKAWKATNLDVPVFAILFGSASRAQLEKIVELTGGKIFDGRKNLVNAFREVKGYN